MKSVVSSWMSQRILIILYQTPSLIMDLTSRTWLTLSPEAMRVILGCTRDTSSTGMWYYLDLPTMTERYNIVRLQDYLRVGSDETNSLHEKVGLIKTSRLSQARNTVSQCCDVDVISARSTENVNYGCVHVGPNVNMLI